ncbi:MAG: DNA-binding protein [Prevotellaceae bacterium]|jgi:predicted histone-like DNA-binding protein|nr:DNA-binding protein [Prevotellaceae bacterium]
MTTALVTVVRFQRLAKLWDKKSPLVYALKRKPGDTQTYDIKRMAMEIEQMGGMSAEDVEHVIKSVVRNLQRKLADGFKVKFDGLGTFFTTFHCLSAQNAEQCTVKNIDRVNVRFKVDNTFRLFNTAIETSTRGASNGVTFELEKPKNGSENVPPKEGGDDDLQ